MEGEKSQKEEEGLPMMVGWEGGLGADIAARGGKDRVVVEGRILLLLWRRLATVAERERETSQGKSRRQIQRALKGR